MRTIRPHSPTRHIRGVASLEFVIIVPILLILLLGIYQIAQLVRVNMKLSGVAVSVADLVAQQANGVSGGAGSALRNFCSAGQLMMTPFPSSGNSGNFTLAVSSVTNYSPGNVRVDWEVDGACSRAAPAIGNTNAIALATTPINLLPTTGPSGTIGVAGDSVIVVQANYNYTSLLQYLAPTITMMTHTGFARPRANSVIPCTSSCS